MDRASLVALCLWGGVGGVTLRRLLGRFCSLEAVLSASEADLCTVPRVGPKMARAIRCAQPEDAEKLLAELSIAGIRAITWQDDEYPAGLRALPEGPPLLFVKGRLLGSDGVAVAIVGTRRPSSRSRQVAESIAANMARRGVTIVSGLALGIDAAAHQGALGAGGRTLAVLGCGLKAIHPRSHAILACTISQCGALLSELHPNAEPSSCRLVARDRIISGLSRWVMVIESGKNGGGMRAAGFAHRQGRVLAAVPGSPGTERLINEGALVFPWPDIDWDDLAQEIRTSTSVMPADTPSLQPPASSPLQLPLCDQSATYQAR